MIFIITKPDNTVHLICKSRPISLPEGYTEHIVKEVDIDPNKIYKYEDGEFKEAQNEN